MKKQIDRMERRGDGFHWRYGVFFKREPSGAVRLYIEHPASDVTRVALFGPVPNGDVCVYIPPNEWESIVKETARASSGRAPTPDALEQIATLAKATAETINSEDGRDFNSADMYDVLARIATLTGHTL